MRSGSATLACGQISATHLLKQSGEIPAIQELLNHSDVKSAKFYTHWLNRDPSGYEAPLSCLMAAGSPADRVSIHEVGGGIRKALLAMKFGKAERPAPAAYAAIGRLVTVSAARRISVRPHMDFLPTVAPDEAVGELLPDIDAVLAERDVPLPHRPHRAAMFIVEHCIVNLPDDLKNGYLTKAWFGSLLAAVIDWYSKIYGKAMRARGGLESTAVLLIRQTPFLLNIPLSTHTAQASDGTFWITIPADIQPEEDPLRWIAEPPSLSELPDDQLEALVQQARSCVQSIRQISNVLMTVDYACERARRHSSLILPHLEAAARHIARQDPLSSSSAIWDANFAAEQAMKCYLLQSTSINVPNTHDVRSLHLLAIWPTPPSLSLIDAIDSMPSGTNAVKYRYSELPAPPLSMAMRVYAASQTICRHYTLSLPRKYKFENARFKMQAPPMPERADGEA